MFGILFNTSIVLILYMISFHCIENKQNEKGAYARDTVAVLIKNTYEKCLYTLQLLDNKTILCKYILPKIEWNKSTPENVVIKNFQILPFTSFDSIINLAISGHIDKAKLNEYLDIKEKFEELVQIKIVCFDDLADYKNEEQKEYYDIIQKKDCELKEKLSVLIG